ncbi:NosD domain-containing protein [Bacillus solimangrovi]|uniref:Periplasmic copper-binding protein NosD beta helix domain-containing protein n=1 Tax=Bacillus solimangrovi TaxID=1305675 RepID=A0A1E5LJ91_9BACI|nr:right-handed parallel beta-helix repeat-containing protein [Bacillus solimangrovi]OEH94162.1 hypothetical protein BFG57_08905 [Bacillus solimangrovi]
MAIHIVPTDFPTVQQAIDDAGTVAGDSIQILAGTFDGFNVNKPRLKIFGCGIGKTIIAGNSSPADTDGITVNANQTILKGFTVQGFIEGFDSDGIEVNSNNNILIEIESKMNDADGFEIDGESNFLIDCSAVFNGADGFDLDTNHHCVINCESIRNGDEGFEINGDFNKFINNISKEADADGFDVENGNSNTLFRNKVLNNGSDGIEMDDSSNNNNIIENLVCGNEQSGIFLTAGDDEFTVENVIDSNIVRNNGTGGIGSGILVLDNADDNIIRFNKLKNNVPFDIQVVGDVMDNTFDGNICGNSFPDGLCT